MLWFKCCPFQAAETPAAPAATTTTTSAHSTPAANPPPNISQSPFGIGGLGGIAGLGEMGLGSTNFMEMQQRMQREVGAIVVKQNPRNRDAQCSERGRCHSSEIKSQLL